MTEDLAIETGPSEDQKPKDQGQAGAYVQSPDNPYTEIKRLRKKYNLQAQEIARMKPGLASGMITYLEEHGAPPSPAELLELVKAAAKKRLDDLAAEISD